MVQSVVMRLDGLLVVLNLLGGKMVKILDALVQVWADGQVNFCSSDAPYHRFVLTDRGSSFADSEDDTPFESMAGRL